MQNSNHLQNVIEEVAEIDECFPFFFFYQNVGPVWLVIQPKKRPIWTEWRSSTLLFLDDLYSRLRRNRSQVPLPESGNLHTEMASGLSNVFLLAIFVILASSVYGESNFSKLQGIFLIIVCRFVITVLHVALLQFSKRGWYEFSVTMGVTLAWLPRGSLMFMIISPVHLYFVDLF